MKKVLLKRFKLTRRRLRFHHGRNRPCSLFHPDRNRVQFFTRVATDRVHFFTRIATEFSFSPGSQQTVFSFSPGSQQTGFSLSLIHIYSARAAIRCVQAQKKVKIIICKAMKEQIFSLADSCLLYTSF